MKKTETKTEAEKKRELEQKWLRENAEALESSNEFVRKHGLPLEKYRQF
jgi:antitoxin CcdA